MCPVTGDTLYIVTVDTLHVLLLMTHHVSCHWWHYVSCHWWHAMCPVTGDTLCVLSLVTRYVSCHWWHTIYCHCWHTTCSVAGDTSRVLSLVTPTFCPVTSDTHTVSCQCRWHNTCPVSLGDSLQRLWEILVMGTVSVTFMDEFISPVILPIIYISLHWFCRLKTVNSANTWRPLLLQT